MFLRAPFLFFLLQAAAPLWGLEPNPTPALARAQRAAPESLEKRLQLARAHRAAGKTDEARAELLEALKRSDQPNAIRCELARLELGAKNYPAARALMEEVFKTAPSLEARLEHFPLLLQTYEKDGKGRELFERFYFAPAQPARTWENALYAAMIYQSQGDRDSMFAVLERALDARPDELQLLRALIFELIAGQRAADALPHARHLASVASTPEHELLLAEVTLAAGDHDSALQLIFKSPESVAARPIRWAQLYPSLRGHPRQAEAAAALEKALAAAPRTPEQRMALVELYLASGQLERMEAPLWALYEEHRQDPLRGKTSDCGGRTISAINLWNRYQSLNSRTALPVDLDRSRWEPVTAKPRSSPAPMALHDQSLLFLSALAVEQRREVAFLARLDKTLEGSRPLERLIADLLVGSLPRMETTLGELLNGPATLADLQMAVEVFNSRGRVPIPPRLKARLIEAIAQMAQKETPPELVSVQATRRALGLLEAPAAAGEPIRRWLATPEAQQKKKQADAFMKELKELERDAQAGPSDSPQSLSREERVGEMLAAYRLRIIDRHAADEVPPALPYGRFSNVSFPAANRLLSRDDLRFLASRAASLFRDPDAVAPAMEALGALPVGKAEQRHRLAQAVLLWHWQWQDEAVALLRQAATKTDDPLILLQVAMAEAEAGNFDEAVARLEALPAEADPGRRSVLLRLLRAAREMRDQDRMRDLLERVGRYKLNVAETDEVLTALHYLGMDDLGARLKQQQEPGWLPGRHHGFAIGNWFQRLNQPEHKEKGVAFALDFLAHPPSIYGKWFSEQHNRRAALELLNRYDAINAYRKSLENRAQEEGEASLTTRLQLLELYAFLKDSGLEKIVRLLSQEREGDTRFQARLGLVMLQAGFRESGLELLNQVFRDEPGLLAAYGSDALSFYKQANAVPTLAELAMNATPHDVAFTTALPIWFYQKLGEALSETSPEQAIQLWEKGLSLREERPSSSGTLRERVVRHLAAKGRREQLADHLIAYFFPAFTSLPLMPWMGFHYPRGTQWMEDFHQTSDHRRHLRAIPLARIGLKAGLKEKLVEAGKGSPQEERYFDQLLRLAEYDRTVLEEIAATTPSRNDRYRFAHYLQAVAREAATWPDGAKPALQLLRKAAVIPSFNALASDLYDEIVELAEKSGDPGVFRKACLEWYEAFLRAPRRGFYDSRRMGRMALTFVEAGMMEQARKIYEKATSSDGIRHQDEQTLSTLKAIFDAQEGRYEAPQAVVGLAAAEGEGSVTVFWNISPEGLFSTSDAEGRPFVASKVFPIFDGLFELELLHRTPPNQVRRLATLPAVPTSGEWRGSLPSGEGELSARLIDREGIAYEGLWTPYSLGQNLLSPLSDGQAWNLPEGVTVSPLRDAPHRGMSGVELTVETTEEETISGPTVPLKSHTIYFISGWFRQDQVHSGRIVLEALNAQGDPVSSHTLSMGNFSTLGWGYFSHKVALNSSSRRRQSDLWQLPDQAGKLRVKVMLQRNVSFADLRLTVLAEEE